GEGSRRWSSNSDGVETTGDHVEVEGHFERIAEAQEQSGFLPRSESESPNGNGVWAAHRQPLNEEATMSHVGFHRKTRDAIHHADSRSGDVGAVSPANTSANRGGGDPLTERRRSARHRQRDRHDERLQSHGRKEPTTSHWVTAPPSGSVTDPLHGGSP